MYVYYMYMYIIYIIIYHLYQLPEGKDPKISQAFSCRHCQENSGLSGLDHRCTELTVGGEHDGTYGNLRSDVVPHWIYMDTHL